MNMNRHMQSWKEGADHVSTACARSRPEGIGANGAESFGSQRYGFQGCPSSPDDSVVAPRLAGPPDRRDVERPPPDGLTDDHEVQPSRAGQPEGQAAIRPSAQDNAALRRDSQGSGRLFSAGSGLSIQFLDVGPIAGASGAQAGHLVASGLPVAADGPPRD